MDSTIKSRSARLKVWNQLATQANCEGPLTAHSTHTIVGALLRAGFRSSSAYFAAAKRQHIETYKTWDPELDLIVSAEVSRASKRGQGPPSRAAPFPLLDIANYLQKHQSTTSLQCSSPDGPRHPWKSAILSTWGLLREIEVANLTLADIRTCKESRTITLTLPASKADPAALGTSVTVACVCNIGLQSICPYCTGRSHLRDMVQSGQLTTQAALSNLPLFPSTLGSWCSKPGLITAISDLASAAGHSASTRRGAGKWGGHAFRRGGVHLLATLGFSRDEIKALARHSSSAIDGYLDGADLSYIKRLLPDKFAQNRPLATVCPLATPADFPPWSKVKMARGGKVHLCEHSSGRTLCGWPWAAAMSRCIDAEALELSCGKCGRAIARKASSSSRRPASSSSSTGSTSSSTSC